MHIAFEHHPLSLPLPLFPLPLPFPLPLSLPLPLPLPLPFSLPLPLHYHAGVWGRTWPKCKGMKHEWGRGGETGGEEGRWGEVRRGERRGGGERREGEGRGEERRGGKRRRDYWTLIIGDRRIIRLERCCGCCAVAIRQRLPVGYVHICNIDRSKMKKKKKKRRRKGYLYLL